MNTNLTILNSSRDLFLTSKNDTDESEMSIAQRHYTSFKVN